MRILPAPMQALLDQGGPFIGLARADGFVTVQPDWTLTEISTGLTTPDATKLPFRWFQRLDNAQTEMVIPGIQTINWDRDTDTDVGQCTITIYNQTHDPALGANNTPGQLGNPGYLSWGHGHAQANARWGQEPNLWEDILIPNALLRTYEGYPGDLDLAAALAGGYVILTGLWLVDDVQINTNGMLQLTCRDMGKLLVEQQTYLPLMPRAWYPLAYYRYLYVDHDSPAVPDYSHSHPVESGPGLEGPKYVTGIEVSADGKGYWVVGSDGGVFAFGVPFYGSRGGDFASPDWPQPHAGELVPGNLDLAARPIYDMGDGTIATVRSITIGPEPEYVLIPTIVFVSGTPTLLSDADAIAHYVATGEHLGKFDTEANADAYAEALHIAQANWYGSVDTAPMIAMAADPLNRGYWLASANGGVFAFGEVGFYGSASGDLTGPQVITGMAVHPNGRGYWLTANDGAIFAFGTAAYLGGTPAGASNIVDVAATPTGNGYWLLDSLGHIYAYGDAAYYGGGELTGQTFVGMAVRPSGFGYWLATATGNVYGYGTATVLAANGDWVTGQASLADPIFGISSTPTGNGYILTGGDGGIFAFGDAPFWGSLPSEFQFEERVDGNMLDFTDIVRDLLRWAGFLAYGDGGDSVFGYTELSGTFPDQTMPATVFDKQPIIDPINQIKEALGWTFFIYEDGSVYWGPPNWYTAGNLLFNGTRTNAIPIIDEQMLLTDYQVNYKDASVRSELIVASTDPDYQLSDTVTTRLQMSSPLLRNMIRPLMVVNGAISTKAEQLYMIDQIRLHISYSLRKGQATLWADPRIQINDQVRIFERQTAETYVHLVTGIHSQHDLDTGEWTYQVTTSWLPDGFDTVSSTPIDEYIPVPDPDPDPVVDPIPNPPTPDPGTTDPPPVDQPPDVDPGSGPAGPLTVPALGWFSGGAGTGIDGPSTAFGTWRGSPTTIMATWLDNQGASSSQAVVQSGGAAYNAPVLDMAMNMIDVGESWAAAAGGAYTSRWRAQLTLLASTRPASYPATIIRPSHEMNGNWYPWSVGDGEQANFITAWKIYVTLARQIAPWILIEFCPNCESVGHSHPWTDNYPGDAWVDIIGVDKYNQFTPATSASDFTAKLFETATGGEPKGHGAWLAFAAAHGKPLTFPEWNGSANQGDWPGFIDGFHAWLVTHKGGGPGQILHECVFNLDKDDTNWLLWPHTRQPGFAAEYQAVF